MIDAHGCYLSGQEVSDGNSSPREARVEAEMRLGAGGVCDVRRRLGLEVV